jgi:hypothetical protein
LANLSVAYCQVSVFALLAVNFCMWLFFVINIIAEVSTALRIRVFMIQPKQAPVTTPTPAPAPAHAPTTAASATLAPPADKATNNKLGKTKTK